VELPLFWKLDGGVFGQSVEVYEHCFFGERRFVIEEMLEFMDYVQNAFYEASNWNLENSYSQLTATARGD
jgi:hypothetical protein